MAKVVLTAIDEGIKEATLSYWHFEEGDEVEEGDDLVEIATDNSTFNVPAPCSGTLKEVFFEEGDVVEVGETLAVIEEGGYSAETKEEEEM